MDPSEFVFDIEAYKSQFKIEERYILNTFSECRQKIEQDYPSNSKTRYLKRDHVAANQRLIDDYFSSQPTYDDAMFVDDYGYENMFFSGSLGTYQTMTTISLNNLAQLIKKVYFH